MEKNKIKGIIFGIIGVFLVGVNPVIIVGRPIILDSYIFACMTCVIASVLFFPMVVMERKKIKENYNKDLLKPIEYDALLNGWKKHVKFLLYLGLLFGCGRIFFFYGFDLAGATLASLTNKTRIILAIVYGYLLLKEKITKKQVFFSFLVFFGLIIVVTEGSFNLIEFNMGVLIILLIGAIWTFAHTQTKPLLERKEATPIFIVFSRSAIGGIVLFCTYFLFFPLENIYFFIDPINIYYFIASGLIHGIGLFCWYKTISYMEFSIAMTLYAPTPVITAFFAYLLLGEAFTIYDLIGTIIIVFSIIMIVRDKNKKSF